MTSRVRAALAGLFGLSLVLAYVGGEWHGRRAVELMPVYGSHLGCALVNRDGEFVEFIELYQPAAQRITFTHTSGGTAAPCTYCDERAAPEPSARWAPDAQSTVFEDHAWLCAHSEPYRMGHAGCSMTTSSREWSDDNVHWGMCIECLFEATLWRCRTTDADGHVHFSPSTAGATCP